MEFNIEDLAITLNAEILKRVSGDEMVIKIGDKEHKIHILCSNSNEVQFMLDNSYHYAKYVQVNSTDMKLIVDGYPVTVSKFAELRSIAQKSSGAQSSSAAQRFLTSSIPGRVVSVVAKLNDEIKKGDIVVVLESMKMQVAIKAHKDGTVKELKVKEGLGISRNDVVAVIE
ncbi:MAG: acetyl-CoA carboxylase biotin carboxyl carrier protein subunit [Nitrososphaerales archaeon]